MKITQFHILDFVFLDWGHKYESVKKDQDYLTNVINNKGTILCDDYNLSYAPGVKKAIDEFSSNEQYEIKILFDRFARIKKK